MEITDDLKLPASVHIFENNESTRSFIPKTGSLAVFKHYRHDVLPKGVEYFDLNHGGYTPAPNEGWYWTDDRGDATGPYDTQTDAIEMLDFYSELRVWVAA